MANAKHFHIVAISALGRRCGLLVFALLIFGLTAAPAAAGIGIQSWNVRHLGWDTELNHRAVARVIGLFDLVAIQEVMDAAAA